eukprot:RCo053134
MFSVYVEAGGKEVAAQWLFVSEPQRKDSWFFCCFFSRCSILNLAMVVEALAVAPPRRDPFRFGSLYVLVLWLWFQGLRRVHYTHPVACVCGCGCGFLRLWAYVLLANHFALVLPASTLCVPTGKKKDRNSGV